MLTQGGRSLYVCIGLKHTEFALVPCLGTSLLVEMVCRNPLLKEASQDGGGGSLNIFSDMGNMGFYSPVV